MLLVKILFCYFILTFIVSCSTTPDVGFKTYPVDNKLNYKAALILDDHFKNYWHTLSVSAPCFSTTENRVINKGNMSTKVTVGSLNEKFFRDGFAQLFEQLDVYKSTGEIKNREKYDFLLFPDISIQTSYDQERVRNRKIPGDVGGFSSFMKFSGNTNNYFFLRALVNYQLNIRDAKNNSEIVVTSGTAEMPGSTYAVYCGEPNDLARTAQSTTGNALKLAFIRLIKDTEAKLSSLSKDKLLDQPQPVPTAATSDNKKPSLLRELPKEEPVLMEQPAIQPENNIKLSLGKVYILDKHTKHTSGNGNSILEAGETVMLHVRLIKSGAGDIGSIIVVMSSESDGVSTEGVPKINKAKAKKSDREGFEIQQVINAADGFRERSAILRIKVTRKSNTVIMDEKITLKTNPSLPLF